MMWIRAVMRHALVADVPAPYNIVQLKVFYPADTEADASARASGMIPPARNFAPYPVMVFWVGVNCEAYMVYWLAEAIAAQGVVVAVASWVGQNLEGRISITPGIHLDALRRGQYGQTLVSSSLPAILDALQSLANEPLFRDVLDLNRLLLAGHSAGGAMALMNAHRHLLPQVIGVISYFANPLATTALAGEAFVRGALPRLADDLPLLIIGGSHDGVSLHHNQLYGRPDSTSADITLATLVEGVSGQRADRYAIVIDGATHYSIAHPVDHTIGRTYLDNQSAIDGETCRHHLVDITRRFIAQHVQHQDGLSLASYLPTQPAIACFVVH